MDTLQKAHPETRQFSSEMSTPDTAHQVANTSVLEQCNITGIETLLVRTQFRWCGHVSRMSDDRIPKRLLYGQLSGAKRRPGGQRKRYKDQLRVNLQACDIDPKRWEALAADRSSWRALFHNAVDNFEEQRTEAIKTKRVGGSQALLRTSLRHHTHVSSAGAYADPASDFSATAKATEGDSSCR